VESRWAAAAIRVGLDEMRRRMTRSDERLVLLDEPERGLHRSAEIRIGDFIAKLQKTGSRVLVASHSPALLNDARLARVHVQRDDITGKSRLNPLWLPVSGDKVFRRFAAEQLGLTTADILQLIRVFVIVEGQHDRAVIANLLHR
jgi:energy-coupling factor transporter ATP-binding protein EcfA2